MCHLRVWSIFCTGGSAYVCPGSPGSWTEGRGRETRCLCQGHWETQVDLRAPLPPDYNHAASRLWTEHSLWEVPPSFRTTTSATKGKVMRPQPSFLSSCYTNSTSRPPGGEWRWTRFRSSNKGEVNSQRQVFGKRWDLPMRCSDLSLGLQAEVGVDMLVFSR